MKKTFTQVALATVALATLAGSAHADLNFNGAVGLPLNPTAQIPAAGGARIQANYYDLASGASYYGLFAAARVGEKIEINGGVNKLESYKSGFALGAKYLISREGDPAGVRLAVGGGYNQAFFKNTNAYVVASKYLGAADAGRVPITGHLGVRYDNFDAFGGSSDKFSVFAGAEVPISQGSGFVGVGEVGTKITGRRQNSLLDFGALSSRSQTFRRLRWCHSGRSGGQHPLVRSGWLHLQHQINWVRAVTNGL